MRRIAIWFLSTVTVVVLLFGYHTSTTACTPATAPGVPRAGGRRLVQHRRARRSRRRQSSSVHARSPATSRRPQWGPVQVAAHRRRRRVTDVAVLQYPTGNSKDEEINAYALPILIQETLDAQSADIDMVSGATVTSVGYLQSLQSALDQAGL